MYYSSDIKMGMSMDVITTWSSMYEYGHYVKYSGTVVYIDPKKRWFLLEFHDGDTPIREAFQMVNSDKAASKSGGSDEFRKLTDYD